MIGCTQTRKPISYGSARIESEIFFSLEVKGLKSRNAMVIARAVEKNSTDTLPDFFTGKDAKISTNVLTLPIGL